MMMLVAAKWREFSSVNPHTQEQENDSLEEPDYTPKPSRSRSVKVPTLICFQEIGFIVGGLFRHLRCGLRKINNNRCIVIIYQ